MKNKVFSSWFDKHGCDSKHPERIIELELGRPYFEDHDGMLTDLTEFTCLKKLALKYSNDIVIKPEAEVILPSSLEELTISKCKLSNDLSWIASDNLVKLELDNIINYNQMSHVIFTILNSGLIKDKLKELRINSMLLLEKNKPALELPKEFGLLTNLNTLVIRGWELSTIPDSLKNLGNLKELCLSFNNLRKLPEVITDLSWIEELSLSYNKLSELPCEIGNFAPNEIEKRPGLIKLKLEHNQLRELPIEITYLTNLEWLDLNHNRLTCLPDTIYELKNLKYVNLDYNQLKELPGAFIDNLIKIKKAEHPTDFFKSSIKDNRFRKSEDNKHYYLGGGYKLKIGDKEFNPVKD